MADSSAAPRPPFARQRWMAPVLVSLVALTVGGAFLVREQYQVPTGSLEGTVASPSTPELAPEQQPGSPVVQMTPDALAHPLGPRVRQLLQTYFDAINGRNYDRWMTTVSIDRVRNTSRSEWLNDYSTTRDGSILIYRVESAPSNRLRVLVGFTSTQDTSHAPLDLQRECIRWRLSLPIAKEQGTWKIDEAEPGTQQEHEPC